MRKSLAFVLCATICFLTVPASADFFSIEIDGQGGYTQLGAIERAVGHQIPRRQLKGFDHTAQPTEPERRGADGPRPFNQRRHGGPSRKPSAPPRHNRSQRGHGRAQRA